WKRQETTRKELAAPPALCLRAGTRAARENQEFWRQSCYLTHERQHPGGCDGCSSSNMGRQVLEVLGESATHAGAFSPFDSHHALNGALRTTRSGWSWLPPAPRRLPPPNRIRPDDDAPAVRERRPDPDLSLLVQVLVLQHEYEWRPEAADPRDPRPEQEIAIDENSIREWIRPSKQPAAVRAPVERHLSRPDHGAEDGSAESRGLDEAGDRATGTTQKDAPPVLAPRVATTHEGDVVGRVDRGDVWSERAGTPQDVRDQGGGAVAVREDVTAAVIALAIGDRASLVHREEAGRI